MGIRSLRRRIQRLKRQPRPPAKNPYADEDIRRDLIQMLGYDLDAFIERAIAEKKSPLQLLFEEKGVSSIRELVDLVIVYDD